jgi:hypothetical protein
VDFVSRLALILLTQVGYSGGAVVAGKDRQVFPDLLDLISVSALWAVALIARAALGKWLTLFTWLFVGLTIGASLTGLRRERYPYRKPKASVTMQSTGRLRRWWKRWKIFATETGNYQSRMLLAFFYFVFVTPFGISIRLFGDPLRLRQFSSGSFWIERQALNEGIERAREQF